MGAQSKTYQGAFCAQIDEITLLKKSVWNPRAAEQNHDQPKQQQAEWSPAAGLLVYWLRFVLPVAPPRSSLSTRESIALPAPPAPSRQAPPSPCFLPMPDGTCYCARPIDTARPGFLAAFGGCILERGDYTCKRAVGTNHGKPQSSLHVTTSRPPVCLNWLIYSRW